jgi:hypothetical protein
MAVEVAEGCRGDIGPQRVQKSVEGDRGLKRGQIAVEGTEGRRGNIGP